MRIYELLIRNCELLIRKCELLFRNCELLFRNCELLIRKCHFILHCPLFHDLRVLYLKPSIDVLPGNTFVRLMSSTEDKILQSLAAFTYHAFEKHKLYYANQK